MDKGELTKKVIELHRQVNRSLGRYTHEGWMDLNLTFAQLKSLLFIAGEKKTNLKKLATALGVTPSNVTGIVERLVEQGLITRQGCSEDRRVLLLATTEAGDKLVERSREARASRMTQILASATNEELATLEQAFNILLDAVKAYEQRNQAS